MPVLILLAVVWAIVLVPPFVRSRSDLRPGSSVSSFRQDLAVIGRTQPSSSLRPIGSRPATPSPSHGAGTPIPGTPAGSAAARKRRRDVLFSLAGVCAFTLLLALGFGGAMVLLHLVADVVLAGYVVLLVQMRKAAEERATKVRFLAAPPQSQPRLVAVRRTANG